MWLSARIRSKWSRDSAFLPLTPDHRELYDIIHWHFWEELGDFPDLVHCRDFNDRMQWLKLFDQDLEIVRCSDKIQLRERVRERLGDGYMVHLYQIRQRFAEIDFEALPDAFVLKTNHDSGSVILVRDKSKFDIQGAQARIDASLERSYGWPNGEWAYSYVEPKVFVEEFIEPDRPVQPADYKFYVVDGKVRFCHYIYDRDIDPKEQTIDLAGNDLGIPLYPSFKLGNGFRKPDAWSEMIEVAQRVAAGFKFVRVDLYCPSHRIYVGEMTFWPMAGTYSGRGQRILGQLLDFDRTTFKPCVLPDLERTRSRFELYREH